jgi:hypothetical protein
MPGGTRICEKKQGQPVGNTNSSPHCAFANALFRMALWSTACGLRDPSGSRHSGRAEFTPPMAMTSTVLALAAMLSNAEERKTSSFIAFLARFETTW